MTLFLCAAVRVAAVCVRNCGSTNHSSVALAVCCCLMTLLYFLPMYCTVHTAVVRDWQQLYCHSLVLSSHTVQWCVYLCDIPKQGIPLGFEDYLTPAMAKVVGLVTSLV